MIDAQQDPAGQRGAPGGGGTAAGRSLVARDLIAHPMTPWVGLAATAVTVLLLVVLHEPPIDLDVYRQGALDALDGQDAVYQTRPGALPFTYPPFAALVFVPLAVVPASFAAAVLAVGSAAALWRILTLCLRRVGVPHASRVALVAAPIGLLLEPSYHTVRLGQVNLLLTWLILEDLLGPATKNRQRTRGLLLGVAAGIKLTPAIFGLIPLLRGDLRTCARVVGAAAASVAVGFLLLPASSWTYWTSTFFEATRVGRVEFVGNQSLNGAIWRLIGPGGSTAWWLVGVLLTVALTILVVRRVVTGQRQAVGAGQAVVGQAGSGQLGASGSLAVVVAVALCGLLISPITWSHHAVWVIPTLILLVDVARRWHRAWGARVLAGLWLATSGLHVLWWFPNRDDAEYGLPLILKLIQDSYVVLALATLVWLALRTQPSRRPARPGTPAYHA